MLKLKKLVLSDKVSELTKNEENQLRGGFILFSGDYDDYYDEPGMNVNCSMPNDKKHCDNNNCSCSCKPQIYG